MISGSSTDGGSGRDLPVRRNLERLHEPGQQRRVTDEADAAALHGVSWAQLARHERPDGGPGLDGEVWSGQRPLPGVEDRGGNPGRAPAEVGEALGAEEEITDDQQGPALSNQLQRVGEAAELPVRPVAHGAYSATDLT